MSRPGTTNVLRLVVIPAIGVAGLLAACGDSGPSQSEYDQARTQEAEAAAEAQQYQDQAGDLQGQVSDLEGQVEALETQVAGSGEGTNGNGNGDEEITVLMAAKVVPPPTPPPTPDPSAPTPTQAPPRPTPDPGVYEPVGDFAGYVETLATTRASEYNVVGTRSCIGSGAFKRGQRIVFRVEIIDVTTGLRVTDQNAESVVLIVENGDEATGRWSQRGGGRVPDAPWMWSAVWDIPPDYKLGGVGYHLEVTMKDGRTGTWTPPYIVSEESDTRPQVFE